MEQMEFGISERCAGRTRPWVWILVGVLMVGAALAGEVFADDEKPKKKKKPPPRLAAEEYVKALEAVDKKEIEENDFVLRITVTPDRYLHAMAAAYRDGKSSGLNELELEKALRKLHRKIRKEQGKPAFRLHLELFGSKSHFFLEGSWKSALEVRLGGKKVGLKVDRIKPKPLFSKWQIFELDTHNKYKRKLARLRDTSLVVAPTGKQRPGDKSAITLTLKKLRRYIEVPKRNEYERIGINVSVRQIALAQWAETELPPFSVDFQPGGWKLPRGPEALEKLLVTINE